jgi:hypothetical protein
MLNDYNVMYNNNFFINLLLFVLLNIKYSYHIIMYILYYTVQ